jgi:hypothetical protein
MVSIVIGDSHGHENCRGRRLRGRLRHYRMQVIKA